MVDFLPVFFFLTVVEANFKVTSTELRDFSERLFENDYTGIIPEDLNIHFGSHTKLSDHTDKASNSLFGHNDFKKMQQATFVQLLDLAKYFTPETNQTESNSNDKMKAVYEWLDAIVQSDIMERTRKFLLNKGFPPANTKNTFKNYLYQIWFTTYSRGAKDSSSAFEHVFVYDMDIERGSRELKGLHNWLRFQQLEQNNVVDYAGYSQKRQQAINAIFRIGGQWKQSSFLLGTSPELDMALYTLCFAYGTQTNNDRIDCSIKMIDCALATITVFKQSVAGQSVIGTAYPGIDSSTRSGCPPGYRKDKGRETVLTGASSRNLHSAILIFFIFFLVK